jgi:gluconolactonase
LKHAVLPVNFYRGAFSDSITSTSVAGEGIPLFNSIKGPFIAAHESFPSLFAVDPKVTVLARKGYAFAHEAGVYSSEMNEVWFTSNLLDREGGPAVEISRVSLDTGDVSIVPVGSVRLGNGGCSYKGGVLFCDQGSSSTPSQLVYCDPKNPNDAQPILNNLNGRPFNSLNDVIVLKHESGDLIVFTDPPYGHEQGFRPACQLPPAVYSFDPVHGHIRMLADGFSHPNGVAFSPDGLVCYVTDTSHIHGTGRLDPGQPSTM